MGDIEIEVKEQWDVTRTIKELNTLKQSVVTFMEHTLSTMGRPRISYSPFGEEIAHDDVEHPLGDTIGKINACLDGCHKAYGKQMWEQCSMLDDEFGDRLSDG
jgi:hypothetical protein